MKHSRMAWWVRLNGGVLALLLAGTLHAQPTDMATSAEALLTTLNDKQQEKVRFDFSAGERRDWTYLPWGHHGLPLKDMTPGARSATRTLAQSALSETGASTLDGVLQLERELHRQAWFKFFRDPGKYYLALFGKAGDEPWGWRFQGHHLSINVTATPAGVSGTPFFTGANPATVSEGPHRGLRVLGAEEDQARGLFRSLNPSQRETALIDKDAPSDILTKRDENVSLECCAGIAAAALTPQQREALRHITQLVIDKLHPDIAATHWQGVESTGFDRLHFAWAGSDKPGEGHYYRIHGPTLLIEYDNTQNDANHVHLVLRDLRHDFGGDLLGEHYRADH